MPKLTVVHAYLLVVGAIFTIGLCQEAYAQSTIDVGGQDQSTQMTAVQDMGSTIQGFLYNVVARVIGVAVGVWALLDFVKREVAWGCVKVFVCGACFFLKNIVQSMAAMGGGT